MAEKIKRCKCGGEARLTWAGAMPKLHFVWCIECRESSEFRDSEEAAINLWNLMMEEL